MEPMQKPEQASSAPLTLLVATRKGAFFITGNPGSGDWAINGPHFLGAAINHIVLDPRDGRTLLMAAHPGHLGPTVYRSTDNGQTWKEASQPPAFPKEDGEPGSAPEAEPGAAANGNGKPRGETVRYTFWLAPGHAGEPGVWWAGTCPPALFRSEDGGDTWQSVEGFNKHPMRRLWAGLDEEFEIPDGNILHSIQIDPRDPRHMYFGISAGGVFETTDGGQTWAPINKGIVSYFLPDPEAEFGHDPHALRIHPREPDLLMMQTHTGIYRMEREAGCWEHIGAAMPAEVGDIGFPIVLHPRDPNTAWVFPMDGTEIWPRTSPGGKPAAYVTRDRGATWQRQDGGFPREHGYFSVKRQAFTSDRRDPLGLYLGTTGGQVWASHDEGESWQKLADYLPEILAVEAVTLP